MLTSNPCATPSTVSEDTTWFTVLLVPFAVWIAPQAADAASLLLCISQQVSLQSQTEESTV